MTKMDVKKGLATVLIAATAGLVGCGGKDKKAEKDTQAQTQASTEAKIEDANSKKIKELEEQIKALSETNSDLQEKVSDLETKNEEIASVNDAKEKEESEKNAKEEEYLKLASEWYSENVEYFDDAGLALKEEDEKGNEIVNIDKIKNIIKIIKGDYVSMGAEERDDALDGIKYMIIHPELKDAINVINKGEKPVEKIKNNPSFAKFIDDEEVKAKVEKMFDLQHELIVDVNDDYKISDEIKNKYEETFFDMEYENVFGNDHTLNEDYDNKVYTFILSNVYWSLIERTSAITQKPRLYTDKYDVFPGGVQIAPETEEEAYVLKTVGGEIGLEGLTDSEKHIYSDYKSAIPQTKYNVLNCESRIDILNQSEDYQNDKSDTQSKLDLLNQKKVLLQTLKANREYTSYISFEENTLTM